MSSERSFETLSIKKKANYSISDISASVSDVVSFGKIECLLFILWAEE